MASRLRPSDTQRLTRAHEILSATGRSLAHWQQLPREPVLDATRAIRLVVLPPRSVLLRRCEERFDRMMQAGALEEVRGLKALSLSPDLPIMRALGVPPLMRHLEGVLGLEEAVELAKAQTREYVKRQITWLNHNMIAWRRIITQDYFDLQSRALDFVLETIDQP
jgi:tRNA dimethylallyltransferase